MIRIELIKFYKLFWKELPVNLIDCFIFQFFFLAKIYKHKLIYCTLTFYPKMNLLDLAVKKIFLLAFLIYKFM